MNFLEEKIISDGVIKEGNILKVDNFLNHQIDIDKQAGADVVGLGVAICMLWPKLQILATCTCALMCAQAGTAQSVRLGLLRLRGILLCGLTGVLIVFLHGLMGQAPLAYIPLAMAGTLLSLVLCRVCGMAPMDCRVGCITYLLVIVATGRYSNTVYALWRFFSSLVGCLLAAGVSGLFHLGRRS